MYTLSVKTQKGFTLIELLVVIAIIGILAAIGVMSFGGSQGKARDAKRKEDLHRVLVSLQAAVTDSQTVYPIASPTAAGSPDKGPVWFGEGSGTSNLPGLATASGFILPTAPNHGPSPEL